MAVTLIRAETQINNASTQAGESGWFIRSDGSIPMAGNLNFADSYTAENLIEPTQGHHAATKDYVDNALRVLDIKQSVRVLSDSNIDLSVTADPNPIDGVTLNGGDRILLTGQTDPAENGIYIANVYNDPAGWGRSLDADEVSEINAGMFCFVEEGTTYADTGWVLTTDDPITLGTTPLTFTQFSGAGGVDAGDGLTKTGNTLDVVAADASIQVNADNLQVAYDTTADTIELGEDGIRVADAEEGSILVAQGIGSETIFVTTGGDATIAGDGTITITTDVVKNGDVHVNETPTGTIDGANTTFTLAATPVAGKEMVYVNGQLQVPGASDDYTISADTITMNYAPLSGDKIRVWYITP